MGSERKEWFGLLSMMRIARYRVEIEAGAQGLLLPRYKGSTLRGGFGGVFRRICCAQRRQDCRGCLLQESCPFAYVFETAPPAGAKALRNLANVPRPFVIEPPLETRQEYQPGDRLSFHLVLIGKGIEYLPYFIVSLEELGRVGIGRGRRPYRLCAVGFVRPDGAEQEIFNASDRTVREPGTHLTGADVLAGAGCDIKDDLDITLLTMTRLKHGKQYVNTLPFHVLVRGLLRRISSLMYFHHGTPLDIDYGGIIKRARQVQTRAENTRWVDWERYSGRHDTRITLGGLVGTVRYAGDLCEFMPFIKIGEYVHVGKGAVFGMGWYRIGGR